MTDQRIQIWNLLHDGEIAAVSLEQGAIVKIVVSIPYLRRRLPPLGASFVLSLAGVRLVEFHHFDGEMSSLGQALEVVVPGSLSTSSDAMPVSVDTTLGELRLDFQVIDFALDSGKPIGFESIVRICDEYWAEWHARTNQSSSPGKPGTSQRTSGLAFGHP